MNIDLGYAPLLLPIYNRLPSTETVKGVAAGAALCGVIMGLARLAIGPLETASMQRSEIEYRARINTALILSGATIGTAAALITLEMAAWWALIPLAITTAAALHLNSQSRDAQISNIGLKAQFIDWFCWGMIIH